MPDIADRLGVVTYGGVRFVSPTKAGRVINVVNLLDQMASIGRMSIWNAEESSSAATTVLTDMALQGGERVETVVCQRWSSGYTNHSFMDYIGNL